MPEILHTCSQVLLILWLIGTLQKTDGYFNLDKVISVAAE